MSSIHYKFRAELDYKTLQFDGLHIRGEQLVREICAKENLKIELFDLQLQTFQAYCAHGSNFGGKIYQ
uniref:DWNN domain-containing protein n=1 Tax=Caenorhabditis japonica TaxID=281687 RepID=A0A8R1IFN0_CAEJA